MKLLQIAAGYFDSALYLNLFNTLEQCGVQNTIFAPVNGKKYLEKQHSFNGTMYICNSKVKRGLFFPKQKEALLTVKEYTDYKAFDVIHAHTLFSGGYVAWKLYMETGIPYIVAVRNTDVNVFFKYMIHLRGIGRKIMRDARGVIFISHQYKEYVLNNWFNSDIRESIEKKSIVVPNGIDEFYLKRRFSRSSFGKNPLRLIYVGEINDNKNLLTTIRAVHKLNSSGIMTRLLAVGPILEEKYKEIIASEELVEYHERCPKEQVIEYLRCADIFVMPSFHETFGLVYAEAMSQGLPIVYTKGQGFDGQFPEGEVGYHVDPNSPEDVVDAVKKILDDYVKISKRCVDLCVCFDWRDIALKYKKIYEDVVSAALGAKE